MARPSVQDLIALDGRLRMVPVDRSALTEAVDRLLGDAATARAADDARRELSCSRAGGAGLVALGRYGEARTALWRARVLAEGLDDGYALAAVHVNLGDAHRYAGDLTAAGPHYRHAVDLGRARAPRVLGFALHHLGKHLVEAGDPVAAVECLHEALALRRAGGDRSLIESTEAALRLAGRGG